MSSPWSIYTTYHFYASREIGEKFLQTQVYLIISTTLVLWSKLWCIVSSQLRSLYTQVEQVVCSFKQIINLYHLPFLCIQRNWWKISTYWSLLDNQSNISIMKQAMLYSIKPADKSTHTSGACRVQFQANYQFIPLTIFMHPLKLVKSFYKLKFTW
jgi:hypothetical protein